MIVFDLICSQGHGFEGWFASGDEFLRQQQAELVRCPICDVGEIERLPSAKVRIGKGTTPAPFADTPPAPTEAISGLPAEVLAKLREIVRNTEDVGERFPEEARRIHYQEAPERAIRGQASREDALALTEEGIAFSSLPSILTRDTH
jgi:hypothetical protein